MKAFFACVLLIAVCARSHAAAPKPTAQPRPTQAPTENPVAPARPVPVTSRKVINMVQPIYPADLLAKRAGGRVMAKFHVLPDGSVAKVEAVTSPHEEFARAVEAVGTQWRFAPAPKGETQTVTVVLPVEFNPKTPRTK